MGEELAASRSRVLKGFSTVGERPDRAPPPLRRDRRPPPPRARGYVWADGYWDWRGGRYVWVPGRWIAARRGRRWSSGQWRRQGPNWVFVPGGWH
ncbi:YXWGXW repeat-containing protein [Burkholderia gladioli]|uniref:YXWGXW repeat-containing protein n=1 Tax=Burkholderia gladioli TaxID=28095 RepID=UPI00264BD980|nr:YXWGXW repeat-containing protein [Burkholderia gladioli]MDN7921267.1 YXWGXW repeat-containing protein [Burkholderia gladioli]